MNERLLIDVVHSKPAVPLSASTCRSVACLNVREGSRPAVRGERPGYRYFGWICDGPLCDGETRIRTFIWWLDLAEGGNSAFGSQTRGSGQRDKG